MSNHRHEDVVLGGNGPILLQSIPAPGPLHGLAAEQAALLHAVLEHEHTVDKATRRQRRPVRNVWRRFRARLVQSPA